MGCRLEEQGSKLQQQEQAVEQQMNVAMTDIHKADNRLKQLRSSMKTMQASTVFACKEGRGLAPQKTGDCGLWAAGHWM